LVDEFLSVATTYLSDDEDPGGRMELQDFGYRTPTDQSSQTCELSLSPIDGIAPLISLLDVIPDTSSAIGIAVRETFHLAHTLPRRTWCITGVMG
jgi:hypothetical protein